MGRKNKNKWVINNEKNDCCIFKRLFGLAGSGF